MKRAREIFGALVLLFLASGCSLIDRSIWNGRKEPPLFVAADRLHVRRCPSRVCKSRLLLARGQQVTAMSGLTAGWQKVAFAGRTAGWVSAKYLKRSGPSLQKALPRAQRRQAEAKRAPASRSIAQPSPVAEGSVLHEEFAV